MRTMAPILKICCTHLATKTLVWSLIVSILMASLPIPVAVVSQHSADADASIPYPCRNSKCGCKSALQCWTSCCCHTPQQRLDWAAKNRVAVPEYGQHLKQLVVEQKAEGVRAKPACCQKVQAVSSPKADCCSSKIKTDPIAVKAKMKVVVSMLALGCRGSSGELACLPWALVALPEPSRGTPSPLESNLLLVDDQGPAHFHPPELPPPRIS